MKISYLVHNVWDAAVRRRVSLFELAGHRVSLGGFHRDPDVPSLVSQAPVTCLGQTGDGQLFQRVRAVLHHCLFPGKVKRLVQHADVVVARNLETLVLARWVTRRRQRLVYECLDIHRLLLGRSVASWLLHRIEAWALRRVDLVFVSAPAFRDAYFLARRGYRGEILLVENLVPRSLEALPAAVSVKPSPPWVIGWFGMLRCRRTLDMLKQLAAGSGGRIEVLIAGRPTTDMFVDFAQEVAEAPGLDFAGAYTASDLPALFARIHFVWAIDYFEEGLNSTWLLPNRLYESIAHGAVPLALRSVATGQWLEGHNVGVLLDDPVTQVPALLEGMTASCYQELRAAVTRVPADAVTMNDAQAIAIANAIAGLS